MGTYIFSLTGVILLGTPQNPATIAGGGYATNTTTPHNGDAICGNAVAAWTTSNSGTATTKASETVASGITVAAAAGASRPVSTGVAR